MKYTLLKIINVSGLTFLEPVVRLCYLEEPALQVRKIGQFILVPILAVIVFVIGWSWMAPKVKTRSGEVPSPGVVWDAFLGIMRFHGRENDKKAAYEMTGKQREAEVAAVEKRLLELVGLKTDVDAKVVELETKSAEFRSESTAKTQRQYDELREKLSAEEKAKLEEVKELAAAISEESTAEQRQAVVEGMNAYADLKTANEARLSVVKEKLDRELAVKYGPYRLALKDQTFVVEEMIYLEKKKELLTTQNREVKVGEVDAELAALESEYTEATGANTLGLANRIVKTEEKQETVRSSKYAGAMTLPAQTLRSLACVFAGFVLASLIAIPIGVLCGLSSTFMAAMTPFIALFKPVSPIVWLPIALIIVSALIPDPDKHWLIQLMEKLPVIGWMKINPAFLASAVTVSLCSLWPTLVNTALGVASIDKDHINVARVLRLGFFRRLTAIVIPSAMPLIFAGLRISLGVGWMVLIAAELLSSSEGVGKFVIDMFNNGSSESFAQMFVVVFVVGVIGFLLDRIMIICQRLVSFDGAPAAI